ncbi:hypothetical protein KGF56_002994 [Candida oxycetoniae]|uniref:Uncharacterized protein n=1 Tax=Candida oxycetoniae TaxID=497107 RepID=A0AAI9SW71_9ASCO|nr:uncharacterized protein KGF56_002994 [Candida oxycetoniae]KAI3404233.2 hypothetical protein KGF56_002994 [Candida oxycetoniae]
MDKLYTALSVSLIAQKRFVISCESATEAIPQFTSLLESLNIVEHSFQPLYTVIDLLQYNTIQTILDQSTFYTNDGKRCFINFVIWQNLQKTSNDLQKELYKLILQIDHYETNEAKLADDDLPASVTVNGKIEKVHKPEIFTIIPFMEFNLYDLKLYTYLKEKFWQSVCFPIMHDTFPNGCSYLQTILRLRKKMKNVFIAPDIKRYIYSLLVFIRCHRLASLSPKSVRVPTATIEYLYQYCQALILWKHQAQKRKKSGPSFIDSLKLEKIKEVEISLEQSITSEKSRHPYDVDADAAQEEEELFVTPDYVKIAMRKIGYWLVDWEYNREFANVDDLSSKIYDPSLDDEGEDEDNEEVKQKLEKRRMLANKRLEISMLTGDWFGSDYYYVNEYLKQFVSVRSYESPTGFTNKIIQDYDTSIEDDAGADAEEKSYTGAEDAEPLHLASLVAPSV